MLANHVLIRRLQERFEAASRIVITVSDSHFGDFRHNKGMMPGLSWTDPTQLARISAFPRPGTVTAGGIAYFHQKGLHWCRPASCWGDASGVKVVNGMIVRIASRTSAPALHPRRSPPAVG